MNQNSQDQEESLENIHLNSTAIWFDDDTDAEFDVSFLDYDITSSPNDFNIKTIVDFIESGPFKIPGFQRNYVWDIKRASKLIESVLIGLPIPQIFLYEEDRNKFTVVDGQQRLMSLYYFVKKRFPKLSKRAEIRRIIAETGNIPAGLLENDQYFGKFNLSLTKRDGSPLSKFHKSNYDTLGDDRTVFDLRTIRVVIIRQNAPEEADRASSVFEIFSRLNSGGVNLRPQEIRSSLHHSDFMDMLARVNTNTTWRQFLGKDDLDVHEKDVEILLRCFSLLVEGDTYREPMGRFLNDFARKSVNTSGEKCEYAEQLFGAFFAAAASLPTETFRVAGKSRRFSIAVFEAVFRAACAQAYREVTLNILPLDVTKLENLKTDSEFVEATKEGIGRTAYVNQRYSRASVLLSA